MEDKLISVIVPVYNNLLYLERCVESIENQSYSNIELIIVDDGSTDGTNAICDSLRLKYKNIKVFHKENGGHNSAKNYGLSRCHGYYVSFIDSDDWIDKLMYETLVGQINKLNVDFVDTVLVRETSYHKNDKANVIRKVNIYSGDKGIEKYLYSLLRSGDYSFCTCLFKKSLFKLITNSF